LEEEKIHRSHLRFSSAHQVTSVERMLTVCSSAAALEEWIGRTSSFDVEEEAPPSLKKKHLAG